jgi:D-glycero-D-manno-heptose 1,7-bisphosphate phosphatase
MLLEARDKFDIDMETSWMISDKEADVVAANAAGINNTILVKSDHTIDEANSNTKFILKSIIDSTQIIKKNI